MKLKLVAIVMAMILSATSFAENHFDGDYDVEGTGYVVQDGVKYDADWTFKWNLTVTDNEIVFRDLVYGYSFSKGGGSTETRYDSYKIKCNDIYSGIYDYGDFTENMIFFDYPNQWNDPISQLKITVEETQTIIERYVIYKKFINVERYGRAVIPHDRVSDNSPAMDIPFTCIGH